MICARKICDAILRHTCGIRVLCPFRWESGTSVTLIANSCKDGRFYNVLFAVLSYGVYIHID